MNQNEKELFFELSKPTDSRLNEEMLMSANAEVLGHLFYNRTAGIAYNNLLKYGLADKLNREFRNALKNAYEVNIEINESYFKCVSEVSAMLLSSDIKAVMLKGAYLCFKYPEGCRTSNDIDILVHPKDIGKLDELLVKNGFRQGTVRKGEFVPASREEIITSKMTRGETVPYVKEVDLPKIKYIEVDVNFSLDFKNGDKDIVGKMLEKAVVSEAGGIKIPTLCKEDFFIHLCAHLYKEATTLPWIRMKRDMTLYKYCDICYLLSEMTDGDTYTLFERAGELNILDVCGFAIINARNLFNLQFSKAIHDFGCVIHKNMEFMGRVFSPEDNKYLRYKTASVKERFFIENRENDITEESIYDKLKNDS